MSVQVVVVSAKKPTRSHKVFGSPLKRYISHDVVAALFKVKPNQGTITLLPIDGSRYFAVPEPLLLNARVTHYSYKNRRQFANFAPISLPTFPLRSTSVPISHVLPFPGDSIQITLDSNDRCALFSILDWSCTSNLPISCTGGRFFHPVLYPSLSFRPYGSYDESVYNVSLKRDVQQGNKGQSFIKSSTPIPSGLTHFSAVVSSLADLFPGGDADTSLEPSPCPQSYRSLQVICIDKFDTSLCDDAFSCIDEGHHYLLSIHCSDMASLVPEGSSLDNFAKENSMDRMFKHFFYHRMLGNASRRASLVPKKKHLKKDPSLKEPKKCISLTLRINKQSKMIDDYNFSHEWVEATPMSFQTVELILHQQGLVDQSQIELDPSYLDDVSSDSANVVVNIFQALELLDPNFTQTLHTMNNSYKAEFPSDHERVSIDNADAVQLSFNVSESSRLFSQILVQFVISLAETYAAKFISRSVRHAIMEEPSPNFEKIATSLSLIDPSVDCDSIRSMADLRRIVKDVISRSFSSAMYCTMDDRRNIVTKIVSEHLRHKNLGVKECDPNNENLALPYTSATRNYLDLFNQRILKAVMDGSNFPQRELIELESVTMKSRTDFVRSMKKVWGGALHRKWLDGLKKRNNTIVDGVRVPGIVSEVYIHTYQMFVPTKSKHSVNEFKQVQVELQMDENGDCICCV
ncbi:hypothetical protein GEMRC1_006492 [Eukaryota sp. GEM-RC1]